MRNLQRSRESANAIRFALSGFRARALLIARFTRPRRLIVAELLGKKIDIPAEVQTQTPGRVPNWGFYFLDPPRGLGRCNRKGCRAPELSAGTAIEKLQQVRFVELLSPAIRWF